MLLKPIHSSMCTKDKGKTIGNALKGDRNDMLPYYSLYQNMHRITLTGMHYNRHTGKLSYLTLLLSLQWTELNPYPPNIFYHENDVCFLHLLY